MALPIPELPVLADDESMLSRKFGREVANYFSGSPLNRLSFLRSEHAFLSSAFSHPTALFLLMNSLSPFAKDATKLAYVAKKDVEPVTGPDPFGKTEEQLIAEFNSDTTVPVVLFLGIDEKKPGFEYRGYNGAPYFAVDVTPRGSISAAAKNLVEALKAQGASFLPGSRHVNLNAPEAAIYAQARSLLDWNARNPFCAGCGSPTLSINAGTKRLCPQKDLAGVSQGEAPTERPDCPTRHGISNLSFPRTDPTIIVAVVSADGRRLLLGRQKRWPPSMYSTLAGFLEPGESIEEAVRREVWEESGVIVGRVVLHSSQPWPFPANIMIGAIAQAKPGTGETINLGNDPELEAAKWYEFDEVKEALRGSGDYEFSERAPEGYKGNLRLPPQTAIANRLLSAVVGGYLGGVMKI